MSLFESKYKGSDGIERDTRFNGNYILNFTLGKEINYINKKGRNKTLGINGRVSLAGGLRYSPIDIDASQIAETTIFDETNAFSLQQKDYFKTDLRIYWKTNREKYTSTLALDIQNITNRKNDSFQYYDSFLEQVVQKNQLGLIPILGYKIEF